MQNKPAQNNEAHAPVVPWLKVRREMGLSEATAWRYRDRGWITTIEIGGRLYVTQGELARFLQRAGEGEFSSPRKPPRPSEYPPSQHLKPST